jgi:hypothetical protein
MEGGAVGHNFEMGLPKDYPSLHSRCLLLLKIEISSIVHCCFSLNQNELKKIPAAT